YRLRMEKLLREVEKAMPAPSVVVGQRTAPENPEPPPPESSQPENQQPSTEPPVLLPLESRLAEFLPLVPAKVWRILVVGKGIKDLAQALQGRNAQEVMAIEFEELESFIPHLTLDQGLVQQLEQNTKMAFDVIVLVDVLEHVPGPERLLRRMAAWL